MGTLAICWYMLRTTARAEMQYRVNFLVEALFGLVYQGIGFVFIWVVVGKFSSIGGWSLGEVTLLYGIQLAGHSLWALSFSRLMLIDGMIREGEYDRMLVRPLPVALQFMFGGFRIATLGDVLGGVALLIAGLQAADIAWSPSKALFLVLAVVGSAMVRGALMLAPSALAFRFLSAGYGQWLSRQLVDQFAGYPLDIFARRVRSFLTYVVPVAFVAWVPGAVLLDRTDSLPFPTWVAWGSPLLGAAMLGAAWWVFLREARNYQSAGS